MRRTYRPNVQACFNIDPSSPSDLTAGEVVALVNLIECETESRALVDAASREEIEALTKAKSRLSEDLKETIGVLSVLTRIVEAKDAEIDLIRAKLEATKTELYTQRKATHDANARAENFGRIASEAFTRLGQ